MRIMARINFASRPGLTGLLLSVTMAMSLVVLPSCKPFGAKVNLPANMPGKFSRTGEAVMPEKWWQAFGDKQLNSLMESAMRENFSLRIAWDRLDQARAVADNSASALWPSLDGAADASRTVRKTATTNRTYTTEYGLGAVARYEVDIWGRVRSTYDASRLDLYATNEDLHAAATTVTVEIARAWFQLIEQQWQLKLLDEQIETNKKYLDIITMKFRSGQVSATDVLQQRQLVESTKGERLQVESRMEVLKNQLAVLLAKSPGSLKLKMPDKLPTLPPLPKTGLPAQLVRRRPDVKAAELRVQSADRRVAAAIADQFPRLGLTITAETTAEQIRNLFDNWMASLLANLAAPLFDGGQRRAEVKRTRAVVSEQINSYGLVVLESLQEVEDALAQEAKQAEYVASLTVQLNLAKQAAEQTLANYTSGTLDFTRYLTTLLTYQRLQRTFRQAELQLVLYRIDLYRAISGTWPLPKPNQAKVAGKRKPVNNPADQPTEQ